MNKIAIIGGSGFQKYKNKNIFFIQRHPNNLPPHKINHKLNLLTIKNSGINNVIGICSVGSLKQNIYPGAFILPDDFINLYNTETIHNNKAIHIIPSFSKSLREKIIKSAQKTNIKLINQGIYYQTQGPRFETKAEIKMISQFADIVGMTMANEATIAQELGLNYISICIVDNYANGINKKLEKKDWQKSQKNNLPKITELLDNLMNH